MQVGDKLLVVRKENVTQSYIPYGSTCEYIATFERYFCVSYENREMLINKQLLTKVTK
jgi:hypothetical protein